MQTAGNEKGYQKESYRILYGWLFVSALVMTGYLIFEDMYSFQNAVVHIGLICFGMLDLLFIWILASDSVYLISGVPYEWAKKAGKIARRKCELLHVFLFCAVSVIYVCYCYGPQKGVVRGELYDAMTAAVLICVAGYLSDRYVRSLK